MPADEQEQNSPQSEQGKPHVEQPQPPAHAQPNFSELEALYANNVRYESSVWDLKLLFGQLEQTSGSEVVEFHTAMTIPWQVAKIMIYFLRLNVLIHEMENGAIRINPRVLPPEPPPLAPELAGNDLVKRAREAALKLHGEFMAEQK